MEIEELVKSSVAVIGLCIVTVVVLVVGGLVYIHAFVEAIMVILITLVAAVRAVIGRRRL